MNQVSVWAETCFIFLFSHSPKGSCVLSGSSKATLRCYTSICDGIIFCKMSPRDTGGRGKFLSEACDPCKRCNKVAKLFFLLEVVYTGTITKTGGDISVKGAEK